MITNLRRSLDRFSFAGISKQGQAAQNGHEHEGGVIDKALTEFIHSTIRSLWTLEVVRLLHSTGARAWTETELERELRASSSVIRQSLADLHVADLLTRLQDGRFQLRAETGSRAALVEALLEAYRSTPAAVMHVVMSGPNEKLRDFASAFTLRKD